MDLSFGAVVFAGPPEGTRRYLLVHHASGGHWDHPKGHPEPGESQRQTARREIREETGAEVRFAGDFAVDASWILPDGREKRVRYFLAEKIGEAAGGDGGEAGECGDEILGTAWLPYTEALERITYAEGRRVLEAAHRSLAESGA